MIYNSTKETLETFAQFDQEILEDLVHCSLAHFQDRPAIVEALGGVVTAKKVAELLKVEIQHRVQSPENYVVTIREGDRIISLNVTEVKDGVAYPRIGLNRRNNAGSLSYVYADEDFAKIFSDATPATKWRGILVEGSPIQIAVIGQTSWTTNVQELSRTTVGDKVYVDYTGDYT